MSSTPKNPKNPKNPKSREEIADEVMGIGTRFALAPTPAPAWAGRHRSGLAPAFSFALVFACGALVAMAADRHRAWPADALSPTADVAPRAHAAEGPVIPPRPKAPSTAPEQAAAEEPSDATVTVLPEVEAAPTSSAPRRTRPAARPRARAPETDVVSSATPASSAASRATRWDTGDPEAGAMPQSLDDLLDGALGGAPTRTATAAPAAELPTAPTRQQVLTTLRALEGEVRMCGEGETGVLNATLLVAGPSGQVTSVRVTGDFAGTDVGRCASRVVSSARFPHFSRDRMQITFPYRL